MKLQILFLSVFNFLKQYSHVGPFGIYPTAEPLAVHK